LNPATFSSSLTRLPKQGTLKGHGKTAFPIRNRWLSEGEQIKAVTNEAVAHGSCTAVQSFTNTNLVKHIFESFPQACYSYDGLSFLRVWTRKRKGVFQRGWMVFSGAKTRSEVSTVDPMLCNRCAILLQGMFFYAL
jgi:hypothetical protein